VLMEVDFFHRVDRQLGRQAGETALRCIATKLLELSGDSAFLASLGGGRFAFLPSQTAAEEASVWAERLRREWAEAEILVGEQRLQFTASLGVAGPAAGSITAAVSAARSHAPTLALEVEVRDEAEIDEALAAGAQRLLLDNMNLEQLRSAVARVAGRAALQASGGVTLETLRAVAATGVDSVSMGSLTHSAPALDLSLSLEPLR